MGTCWNFCKAMKSVWLYETVSIYHSVMSFSTLSKTKHDWFVQRFKSFKILIHFDFIPSDNSERSNVLYNSENKATFVNVANDHICELQWYLLLARGYCGARESRDTLLHSDTRVTWCVIDIVMTTTDVLNHLRYRLHSNSSTLGAGNRNVLLHECFI